MLPHELIVADISRGLSMTDGQLSAVLSGASRNARFRICRDLAMALVAASQHRQSRFLAQRAFGLWDGEPGFIDEYLDLLRADGDAEGIRRVGKRAGMWMAERGELMDALRYFNIHHYAYQSTGGGDQYEYDRDILRAVERLAATEPGKSLPRHVIESDDKRPLRVAYLVFGAIHTVSVLIRLLCDFARYHDHERIECLFFSPDIDILSRQVNAELLRAAGGNLIAVDSPDERVCLLETEKSLREARPDILVSVAALADYKQYYLFASCPAGARIALCYGPPAQFVPPAADWVIAASRHPFMDSPCDGDVVEIEVTLPERPNEGGAFPEGVSIPDDAIVLMAFGRSEKFLCRDYWEAILDVLKSNPKTCFIAFGLIFPPSFLDELLIGEIGKRVTVLGWLTDYHDLLARADIVIDTFPSCGGLTLMDSMAFGIPVVSFTNDYLKPFDQRNWSLAEELLGEPELIVPREDFAELSRRLGVLIENRELRERLGAECKAHILETRGNPERMVRRVEANYYRVRDRMRTLPSGPEKPHACLGRKIWESLQGIQSWVPRWRASRFWRKYEHGTIASRNSCNTGSL